MTLLDFFKASPRKNVSTSSSRCSQHKVSSLTPEQLNVLNDLLQRLDALNRRSSRKANHALKVGDVVLRSLGI